MAASLAGLLLVGGAAAQCLARPEPPSSPARMTIPLPSPVFWDPVRMAGDYAVVDQDEGIFLIRPRTGQVISRLRPPIGGGRPIERTDRRTDSRLAFGPTSPEGWPFLPGDEVGAAPLIVDLDGDGSNEVVFTTRTGWVWVLGRGGLPAAGWPVRLGAHAFCRPAAADLNGDGRLEILQGDATGTVHALRLDGRPLPGWPASIPGSPSMPAIHGAVVAADIDGDSVPEVIVTQASGRVCVLRADGRPAPGWPVSTAPADDPPNDGTIFTRAAVGDLDGDGRAEIIVGANNYRVHVWDASGRPVRGWPRKLDNHGRAGYAEPVLADLTQDGRLEILIATDRGFAGPPRLYALDGQGRAVRGWPVDLPAPCNGPVAVGDLSGNGRLEVAAVTIGEGCRLLLWDHRGRPRPGFPVSLSGVSSNAGPLLADADGDGRSDIIVSASGTGFEPIAFLLAVSSEGKMPVAPFPIRVEGCEIVEGGACVADVDGDGLLEIVVGTEVQGRLLVHDLGGRASAAGMLWPRPGFDAGNTGRHDPAAPRGASRPPAAPRDPEPEGPPLDALFSPLISISFILTEEGHVRLEVMDVQGERIRTLLDTPLPIGAYTITWDGLDDHGGATAPGVYFYQLETPVRRATGQLLLLQ